MNVNKLLTPPLPLNIYMENIELLQNLSLLKLHFLGSPVQVNAQYMILNELLNYFSYTLQFKSAKLAINYLALLKDEKVQFHKMSFNIQVKLDM